MNRRTVRGLTALVILMPVVIFGAVLMACGVNWFPKCDHPGDKCAPVEPDYPPGPPLGTSRDASNDG